MNILDVQDKLKGLSQNQLIQEMQMPSGAAPQFLVLSELTRRKRLKDDLMAQQQKGPQRTVAEEAVAAAGVPQAGLPQLASAMAPKTDVVGNTGAMPTQAPLPSERPQMMADGGPVRKMQEGGRPVVLFGQYFEVLPGGEVVRAGTGDPVSPATAQEVLAKAAQETPVFDPNKSIFDQTAVGELRQTPQQFYETAMGEGVRAQGVNPSYDSMTDYYREVGATAPAPLAAPTADTLPAIGAPTDFTRFAPLYDYGVPEGFSAPSQDPLGLSREAMQPGAMTGSTGLWSDTTDDARAARGFGQSAYLSGLVGPTPAVPGAPTTAPQAPDPMLPAAQDLYLRTYPRVMDTQTGGGTFSADPINVRLPSAPEQSEPSAVYDPFSGAYVPAEAAAAEGAAAMDAARAGAAQSWVDAADYLQSLGPAIHGERRSVNDGAPGFRDERLAAAEETRKINEAAAEPAAPTAAPAGKPEDSAIEDLLVSDIEQSSGGAAPSGGGAAPSGGGGGATPTGAPGASSFEDEILAAIGRSEKRAEQDKWLALAQAGLSIMDAGSRHGTLAGALGEGGAKGIEAFRGGRDAAEETRLNLLKALEDSRMARAQLAMQQAAASRRGRSGLTPYQAAQMARYGRQDALKLAETYMDMASVLPPSSDAAIDMKRQAMAMLGYDPNGTTRPLPSMQ